MVLYGFVWILVCSISRVLLGIHPNQLGSLILGIFGRAFREERKEEKKKKKKQIISGMDCRDLYGLLWITMDYYGLVWISMD